MIKSKKVLAYSRDIKRAVNEIILLLNSNLRIIWANSFFYEIFNFLPEKVDDEYIYELDKFEWDSSNLRLNLENLLKEDGPFEEVCFFMTLSSGLKRKMVLNALSIMHKEEKRLILFIEDVTDRRNIEEFLCYRLTMEELVSHISSEILSVTSQKLDEAINDALKKIGITARIDRCFLELYSDDLTSVKKFYEWCAEGLSSRRGNHGEVFFDYFSCSFMKNRFLEAGHQSSGFREVNSKEEIWLAYDNKTFLAIPLIASKSLIGLFGFSMEKEERIWKKEDIRLLKMIGDIFVNVIERTDMEKKLWKSQQMLQLVLDYIPSRVFWKDCNSVYLGCNRLYAMDAGLDNTADIAGKTDYDLPWKKEESDYFRAWDKRVMETGRAEYNIIQPQLQYNGTEAWLDTNKVPFHDSDGNIIGILGTYEDITQKRKAENSVTYQLIMMELLICISNRLINADLSDMGKEINLVLETIGVFAGLNRSFIVLLNNMQEISRIYEWYDYKGEPYIERKLEDKPFYSWLLEQFKRYKLIEISQVENLPSEMKGEEDNWKSSGFKSFLGIPLYSKKTFTGFFGFTTEKKHRLWEEEDIMLLKLISGIFTSVLRRRETEKKLEDARDYAESIINTIREPLIVLDSNMKVNSASRSFYRNFNLEPKDIEGQIIYEICDGQWNISALKRLIRYVLKRDPGRDSFTVEQVLLNVGDKIMLANARKIYRRRNEKLLILLVLQDITEQRKAEEQREKLLFKLQTSLEKIKTLRGLLPICSACKKIRDGNGSWHHIEAYMVKHTEADFTHGLCPGCLATLYPEFSGIAGSG